MMRYGSDHKAETRLRVLTSAAREISLKGPERIAVADIMASAGLTHGGFYAHFASKEALVAEAIDAMFADTQRRTPAFDDDCTDEPADQRSALRAFLASYISPEHRDRSDRGCPLPTLSGEIARQSDTARLRFSVGLDKLTIKIETALIGIGHEYPASEARAVVSQMVGAVALARAIGECAQSDAILQDTLASLLKRLGI